MRTNKSIIVVGLMLFMGLPVFAHQRSWPGKRLAESLPGVDKFSLKQVSLNGEQVAWIEKNLGEPLRIEDRAPAFYVGSAKGDSVLGTVLFVDANGKNGKVEMGLVIDQMGKLTRVILFEHSENSNLTTETFLSQFSNKTAKDKFKVGVDVVSPGGQEKGAQQLATAIRRGLLLAMAGLRLGAKG